MTVRKKPRRVPAAGPVALIQSAGTPAGYHPADDRLISLNYTEISPERKQHGRNRQYGHLHG